MKTTTGKKINSIFSLILVLASCLSAQNTDIFTPDTDVSVQDTGLLFQMGTGACSILKVSPDKQFLAGSSSGGTLLTVWNLGNRSLHTYLKHKYPLSVIAMQWSYDSKYVAVLGEYKVRSGRTQPFYAADKDNLADTYVQAITDALKVSATTPEYEIRIFDVDANKPLGVIPAGGRVLVWNPTRNQLAYSTNFDSTSLLDLESGKTIKGLGSRYRETAALAFSNDGKIIVETFNDAATSIWDARTGKRINVAKQKSGNVVDNIAIAPQTASFFITPFHEYVHEEKRIYWKPFLKMWDTRSGVAIKTFTPLDGIGIKKISISPDEKKLAVVAGAEMFVLDIASGDVMYQIGYKDGQNLMEVNNFAFSADSASLFLTGDINENYELGGFARWDFKAKKMSVLLKGVMQMYMAPAPDFSFLCYEKYEPDTGDRIYILPADNPQNQTFLEDKVLVISGFDRNQSKTTTNRLLITADTCTILWDMAGVTPLAVLPGVTSAQSPDGKWLVTENKDYTLAFFDPVTFKLIKEFRMGQYSDSACIQFSADSKYLYALSGNGFIQKWDVLSGKRVYDKKVAPMNASLMYINKDEKIGLILNAYTTEILFFEPATMKKLYSLNAPTAIFSPDGSEIAIVGLDNSIQIKPVTLDNSAKARLEWKAKPGSGITAIAYNRQGTQLAVGYSNGEFALFNIKDGSQLVNGTCGNNVARTFAFSPSGKYLLVGNGDGSIVYFDIPKNSLLFITKNHRFIGKYFLYLPDNTYSLSPGMEEVALMKTKTGYIPLGSIQELRQDETFALYKKALAEDFK